VSTQPKPDSWFHSPEYIAQCRRRRMQQRARTHQKVHEEIADPEDISSEERRRTKVRERYFSRENDVKRSNGDPRRALPTGTDLQALAQTFGASPERLAQAINMKRHGLHVKAKRNLLCCRIGRRTNCTASEDHKFFQPYMCRCRCCEVCGPSWFR